jgi:hypothetical protein
MKTIDAGANVLGFPATCSCLCGGVRHCLPLVDMRTFGPGGSAMTSAPVAGCAGSMGTVR